MSAHIKVGTLSFCNAMPGLAYKNWRAFSEKGARLEYLPGVDGKPIICGCASLEQAEANAKILREFHGVDARAVAGRCDQQGDPDSID